ncbi:TetR/AcrR family transcriptional regulator [uncultured Deinococcus sp.]|uniref:TetR/AcrR family transcriptional regulator n=1 Tax=uncultured Deinococcus sp. TaxID=158789 RepID=UPI00258D9FEC|nr:TetR/AcrR family transcriptional regulator [uncultured Deinococcus sp.]
MSSSAARRLKAEDRREQILAAAAALFVERGFEAVGMADVATALQTSRPTVYAYFASTEEMLGALLDDRLQDLPARLEPLLTDEAELSFGRLFLALLEERELLLLLGSGGGPLFRERRRRFLAAIESRLELRELQRRRMGPGREQPLLISLVLDLLSSAAYEQVTAGGADPETRAQVLERFILGGVAAVAGHGSSGQDAGISVS